MVKTEAQRVQSMGAGFKNLASKKPYAKKPYAKNTTPKKTTPKKTTPKKTTMMSDIELMNAIGKCVGKGGDFKRACSIVMSLQKSRKSLKASLGRTHKVISCNMKSSGGRVKLLNHPENMRSTRLITMNERLSRALKEKNWGRFTETLKSFAGLGSSEFITERENNLDIDDMGTCSKCYKEHDLGDHLPVVLGCGHVVCQTCICTSELEFTCPNRYCKSKNITHVQVFVV